MDIKKLAHRAAQPDDIPSRFWAGGQSPSIILTRSDTFRHYAQNVRAYVLKTDGLDLSRGGEVNLSAVIELCIRRFYHTVVVGGKKVGVDRFQRYINVYFDSAEDKSRTSIRNTPTEFAEMIVRVQVHLSMGLSSREQSVMDTAIDRKYCSKELACLIALLYQHDQIPAPDA